MKNLMILLSLFVCGSALATPQERCEELIRNRVAAEAIMKGYEVPAYELSEPEPVRLDHDCGGKTCMSMFRNSPNRFTYHSSVFIVEDGYIPNSGFIATVLMNETTCRIESLGISFGDFNP